MSDDGPEKMDMTLYNKCITRRLESGRCTSWGYKTIPPMFDLLRMG
jgi:hypothetical protein